jgi:HK97 family phage major capsid protein
MTTKLAIPQTAEEMQAMMDDPKVAAQIIAAGQWTEFNRAYAKATDERGDMSDIVRQSVEAAMAGSNAITDQVRTAAQEVVAGLLKEHGVSRPTLGPEGAGNGAKQNALHNPLAAGAALDSIGFANLGDYARSVFDKTAQPDPRMQKVYEVMNAYSSTDPASAGTLIPEQFRSEIYQLALEGAIVRPRASVIDMTGGSISLPYVDVTTHAGGTFFGGMSFAWTPESGTIAASEAKFGRVKLEAKKLVGGARVPNELWNDAPALNSWLMRSAPQGINFTEDVAFLTGVGGSDPLGVNNSPATITVTKEGGQVASTIVVENILKMYSRVLPQALGNTVWLANPTCFPELMTLSIAVGTGGAPVALVNIHTSPTMTMLGRPLILTEKVPALGAAGDVGIYDFSFYLIGDRQAVSMESSEHSRFMNDETELKLVLRVDGRPWIQSALTPKNGSTLSPFVILGART